MVMRFLDTNVLVYAMDPADKRKQKIAQTLLSKAQSRKDTAVSIQVLTEFSSVMLNKFHRPADIVGATVSALARNLVFVAPSVRHLTRALEIHAFCQISIWDALVVAAADEALTRAARNLPDVEVATAAGASVYQMMVHGAVVVTRPAWEKLKERLAAPAKKETVA